MIFHEAAIPLLGAAVLTAAITSLIIRNRPVPDIFTIALLFIGLSALIEISEDRWTTAGVLLSWSFALTVAVRLQRGRAGREPADE